MEDMTNLSPSLDAYLPEVKKLVLSVLAPYPVQVYLFGSYARGDYRISSDVDIAVAGAEALPAGMLAELRDSLEESNLPYRVDLIDLNDAGESFRSRVLEEGILWIG